MNPNPPRPGQRLAMFFDGTWNEPGSHTNVYRLKLMLADQGKDGVPQKAFYDEGVGTHWWDSITGGAFGAGLSDNVRDGYRWLLENYRDGDEIFLFGFSRGAFTARSLAGLIARCGLLHADAPLSFLQIFQRYQLGEQARPLYELIRSKDGAQAMTREERQLLTYSQYRRNLIKMVGVWDTVGSLGVPFGNLPGISSRTLRFHNTRLSTTIQHNYHAMALDEFRQPYGVIPWTHFVTEQPQAERRPEERWVEQRWFAGAHANVGGGYASDPLPQRPLAWMQAKAEDCGLAFRSHVRVDDDDYAVLPTDSYGTFLKGAWKLATLGHRFVRPVLKDVQKIPKRMVKGRELEAGRVFTANERIDASVFERCRRQQDYRPLGLLEWAKRKGLDVESLIQDPVKWGPLTTPVTQPGIEVKD